MKIKILCSLLVLVSVQAVAGANENMERKCKAVEGDVPTYSIPFDSMRTAIVQYAVVKGVKDPANQTDEKIPPLLRDNIKALARPEYSEFLDGAIALRLARAQDAYKAAYQGLDGKKKAQYDLYAECYLDSVADPTSDAYIDARKALDETYTLVSFKAQERQTQVQAQRRESEYLASEAARKDRERQAQNLLEQRRQNPTSSSAEIGPFVVTVDSCTTSVNADFGVTSVSAQPGSRFLILQATFKNRSNTGQFIVPGVLLMNHAGKSYTYNVIEPVLGDPMGVPDGPINPLIAQKVRVVYRVSDEVSGKVRWQPGQNPDRLTLKCGVI
ncbi:hypothetical protein [Pseudomonas sp. H9]|uniref:hypothetical protein n=1 Tax=Pseudomonas sp. H9 TaxID=483968 RepID=UPI001057ABF2|nr:hypothetical protein [Pseudomonas sp. H9]TDF85510.1 hypothetical protein E1573_03870 [Pseudomonas sp. H9]